MKLRILPVLAMSLCALTPLVAAADDTVLQRLALCQDSWLDWKNDPVQMKAIGDHFRAGFVRHDNEPFFVPTRDISILGLKVVRGYPDSVGMGVGFSLLVAAPFDKARKIAESAFHKPLVHCETGDGMHTCELDIAEQRSFTLMTQDDRSNETLVGCYYYYEK